MKNKGKNNDDLVEKIINKIDIDDVTREKLEKQMKKELNNYKNDVLDDNIDLYDEKPFIQKLIFIIVGVVFFPVGYALYFLIRNNRKYNWQANYLVKSSTLGLGLFVVSIVFKIVFNLIELIIK